MPTGLVNPVGALKNELCFWGNPANPRVVEFKKGIHKDLAYRRDWVFVKESRPRAPRLDGHHLSRCPTSTTNHFEKEQRWPPASDVKELISWPGKNDR